MVDIRTVSLPGIWAEDAQTTIPTPPIANTTYRNLEWGETEANQGWPFQKIVDSADFNQAMWYVFTLQKMQEQFGILPWCSTTAYKQNGICLGSDGIFYWAKKDNTGVNPVNDSGMENWGVFLDPGDNFVTETLLNNQIALCEKLANKVQALSSSSTTTQYPSAKCVYDNINNLASTKQNNITGGASTITTANLTANRALISNGSGKVAVANVTSTELGYLDGVTSAVQTQLNNCAKLNADNTFTGVNTFNESTTFAQPITIHKNGRAVDIRASDGSLAGSLNVLSHNLNSKEVSLYCFDATGTQNAYLAMYYNNGSPFATFSSNYTISAQDNTNKVATTAWVNNFITNLSSTVGAGYVYIGNLLIQWGITGDVVTNSALAFSFVRPFANTSVKVFVTQNSDGQNNDAWGTINVGAITTTGATIHNGSDITSPFFWLAIGQRG